METASGLENVRFATCKNFLLFRPQVLSLNQKNEKNPDLRKETLPYNTCAQLSGAGERRRPRGSEEAPSPHLTAQPTAERTQVWAQAGGAAAEDEFRKTSEKCVRQ